MPAPAPTFALQLYDIRVSGSTPIATGYAVEEMLADVEIDKPGTGSFSILASDPVAAVLVAGSGGATLTAAVQVYALTISFGGGDHVDITMLVSRVKRGRVVTVSGPLAYGSYADALIDRLTLHQVSLESALTGAPGTIVAVPESGTGRRPSPFSGVALVYQKGILAESPLPGNWAGTGLVRMTAQVDPAIAGLLVDGDQDANTLEKAAAEFVDTVAGLPIAGDRGPLGGRAHIVPDSSDAALNITGLDRGIAIGHIGSSPHVTFTIGPSRARLTEAAILNDLEPETLLDALIAKYTAIGGYSNHGMPDGWRVRSLVCINTGRGAGSIRWDDSLLLIAAADSTGQGGVFYWPGDGVGYRVGGMLAGIAALGYDEATYALYAATDHGVYTRTADVLSRAGWTRLGGLNGICTGIDVQPGPVIVCDAAVKGGGSRLFRFPAYAAQDGAPAGYAGWSLLASGGDLLGWAYDAGADRLVTCNRSAPATLNISMPAEHPAGGAAPQVPVPNGDHVARLVRLPGGVAILTAAGAKGLYHLADGATVPTNMDPDGSLIDANGVPVMVFGLVPTPRDLILDGATFAGRLVALTDAGLFYSTIPIGGDWRPSDQQSGILDQQCRHYAMGAARTIVNKRVITECWVATDLALLGSHTAGIWWTAESEDKLSIGAYVTALGFANGAGPHLPPDVTGLGTIAPGGTTGSSGRTLPIRAGSQGDPGGYLCVLAAYDERNKRSYKIVDTDGRSPTSRTVPGEFAHITTDASTGVATASGILAKAIIREMRERNTPQHILQIDSVLPTTAHALRTLRPTHMIRVIYDLTPAYPINLDVSMYVHRVVFRKTKGENILRVQVHAGTTLALRPPTEAEVADGLLAKAGRMHRHGKMR